MPGRRPPPQPQRGVSLVEALVAMAVMAFGMLAVVGLQATMRLNADVAKQRSEAVRIAQEAIEDWRDFSTIPTTAGRTAFADIGSMAATAVTGYTTNTSYMLTRTVTPGQGNDAVQVQVSWEDRAGQTQSVSLSSVIAAADPALSGVLTLNPGGTPLKSPMGRSANIPVVAVDRGDGSSAYRPPTARGQTIVWVFDNLSGVVTSVCNYAGTDLESFDTSSCLTKRSFVLTGYVRFSLGATPDALNPTDQQIDLKMLAHGTSGYAEGECFVDDVQSPKLTYTPYACRVDAAGDGKWSGNTVLVYPLDLSLYDVCRYSTGMAYDPLQEAAYNLDHPAQYVHLTRSLASQNFLVVTQGVACPAVAPALTQAHQPPL